MSFIDIDNFYASVNNDPEFLIAARFWDILLTIDMGENNIILKIQDGKIADVNRRPARDDPWAFKISAPAQDWEKFLKPVPEPFYHDIFAASIHHGFVCEGDLESMYAYYPAIRRMFEIMRTSVLV
ncbi:MAG: hypothetical protein ISS66_12955 [Desulfobacteraceae bacterium]|nr:hypothetical protein [Desulfobacteraceae bacterium]